MNDTTTKRSALSKKEATLLSKLGASNKNIFAIKEAQEYFAGKYNYLVNMLNDLVRKGWLERIKPGLFLIVPLEVYPGKSYTADSLIIANRLVNPSYISFSTALNYYGLTEQPANTIFSATTKQRKPYSIHGVSYYFATISKNRFFGYKPIWVSSVQVNIAEKEKALIDSFYRIDLSGGIVEVFKALSNASSEIDWEIFLSYLEKMKSKVLAQRIGFFLERDNLAGKNIISKLQSLVGQRYLNLDPNRKRSGKYIRRWMLILNVTDNELDGWKGY